MSENIIGKITAKYEPKKPGDNYTAYISGSDGTDYRVYLPKCDFKKDDIVHIRAATAKESAKGSVYYTANNINLLEDNAPEPVTNGHTEPTRQPIPQNLSHADKGSDMMETGIWTRAAPSVCKTIEDVERYCDRALAYRRRKIGGNDEFNDQF
tara:strand:- start:255 stop:713 length:459 start_codon:yes stop_codon:yes gene_type:complete